MTAALAGLLGSFVIAAPATAAEYPAVLDISKSVSRTSVEPGQSFTYTIAVDCSSAVCLDAQVVDVLPPEFDALTLNTSVIVTGAPSTYAWSGENSRTLTVNFTRTVDGGVGLDSGDGPSIQVTFTVPLGISPDWAYNGVPVENSAEATASNAESKSAAATTTVVIPYVIDTAASATWSPSSTRFRVGEASSLTLTTRNTSNALAESLTLTAPTDPTAASSFFDVVDLTGFGDMTFPEGADRVQVDAWVTDAWVLGSPAATAALPGDVTWGDVTGVRLVFTSSAGTALAASGTAGSFVLDLAQRSTFRSSGSSLVVGKTVTAHVTGTVSVPEQGTDSATATASYEIGPLTSVVSGSTGFETSRIPAGTSTIATTTGRNDSNGILQTFTISQPATGIFSDASVTFGGFRSLGFAWPTGATGATVSWLVDSGSAPADSELEYGDSLPATPALGVGQKILGFEVEFAGAIEAGATTAIPFRVEVAEDAAAADPGARNIANQAWIDGFNDAGAATRATPSATLEVLYPQINVALGKEITPSKAVPAGGLSTVKLTAVTVSDSGYVSPTEIVFTDVDSGAEGDYWSAFDLIAIAPTQVPAGAILTIETTTNRTDWSTFATVDASAGAMLYRAEVSDRDIVGMRFTFTNDAGFSQGSTTRANLSFQARDVLRGTSTPTAVGDEESEYLNTAAAVSTGDVELPEGGTVSDSDAASDIGTIKTVPAGSGALELAKTWQKVSGATDVPSQSREKRTARIEWKNQVLGYDSVVISDPADPSDPVAETIFQTFNLTQIKAINSSNDPYIAYDQVESVEIFDGSTWTRIGSCSPASPCEGSMPAITLTTLQQESTVGLRITFAEYEAGRTADAEAPPVGSGVAGGPEDRTIDLVFELRNTLRDTTGVDEADRWITESTVVAGADAGTFTNSAAIAASGDAGSFTGTASDSLLVIDGVPSLSFAKSSSKGVSTPIAIPYPGDVAESGYPTSRFTLTATNAAASHAWYIRVTDQQPCTVLSDCAHLSDDSGSGALVNPYDGYSYDPATNPFEKFTITKVSYSSLSGTGISASASTVTVLRADGATETVALNSSQLSSASFLADVVGVSALFAGSSTSDGGTITPGASVSLYLDTQLRKFLRSEPATLVGPGSVTNAAFAQLWDEVLVDDLAYGSSSAVLSLESASLDVAAGKTFRNSSGTSISSLLEKDRSSELIIRLTANQGSATASPNEVVVEDTDADFWAAFELRSFTSATLPAGANRVRVDVQLNGADEWVQGTAVASGPSLPSGITLTEVTGIRVVYTKADGTIFSTTAPAAAWNATINFVVALRASVPSSAFPSSISDTAVTTVRHPSLAYDTASATDSLALATGTFVVDISKTPAVTTTPAGETVDFTLVMKNPGTGFLDNPVVVDQLPIDASLRTGGPLVFDPTSEITFTTSTGGILPTSGVDIAYDDEARTITLSWPDGSRLAPDETYTIVIPLLVAPGLEASYVATNQMEFSSDRTLSSCTNTSGNGKPVVRSGATCSTEHSVSTFSASAITSFKGVKGDVDDEGASSSGAQNVKDSSTACVSDAEGFYRQPCAANTVIGGTDLWKLQFTNGGNVPASSAAIVDVLPDVDDAYLRSGASRESDYRPVFAGAVALATDDLSEGTTMTWQVTTTADPCPDFESNALCTTATWVDGASFPSVDYPNVTGVRVQFDFSGIEGADNTLPPAATLKVTYETVNVPSTSEGDNRAPVTVPVTEARAWNSFGVFATFPGFSDRRVEPVRAGVQLATGPLQITKVMAGAAAAYAPSSVTAVLACEVEGAEVILPSSGEVTLSEDNATPYVARVDGIPVGTVCEIVESGSGASSVSYSPATTDGDAAVLTVATAATSIEAVPSAHRATITNTYGTTQLRITKDVTTTSTVGTFGPYDFTLECSVDTGAETLDVPLAAGDAAFTLADGDEKLVTGLPVTADCDLREVDADGANRIRVTVDDGSPVTVAENGPATIALGTAAEYAAVVENHFAGGVVSVLKSLSGDGADSYGAGPFTVEVTCVFDGQTLLETELELEADVAVALDPIFPQGTVCTVVETDAGGATTAAEDAAVTVPGPTGEQVVGAITAGLTNDFAVGSLDITKVRDGAGATAYGVGPFTAQVTCTWQKSGETLTIPLPDGGAVTLSSANGYAAEVTGLIAGADCSVTETGTGGATESRVGELSPALIPAGESSTVTITNTFDTGSLTIDKVRTGDGAERFGAGPFEVSVECRYLANGSWRDIDLGADATQQLSADNDYAVTLTGLLLDAVCTVEETDAGLAVESSLSPSDGTVTITDARAPAQVTVTNTFRIGTLDLEKDASEELIQGGQEFEYTIDVRNIGDVDAAEVTVVDEIDALLTVRGIVAPGWTDCAVLGADSDGFGGTLTCVLDTVLGIGGTAPTITVSVSVDPEIRQDELANTAAVTSTTRVVDGDEDTVTVRVMWLDATVTPQCLSDAPWLYYSVDAHNLAVGGRTMVVDWLDADDNVISTVSIALTEDGVVDGRLLWPGASIDGDERGTGWPGWREALPGETPDWENLVLDPELPEYALRSGAQVRIAINPETTLEVEYPPATLSCGETPSDRESELWFEKSTSATRVDREQTFDYTMSIGNEGLGAVTDVQLVDDVPDVFKIVSVTPQRTADGPQWVGCEITDRLASGYGGTIVCDLDRALGYQQRTPDITLTVKLSPAATPGTVVNVGLVSAIESSDSRLRSLETLALDDDATIWSTGTLALTGNESRQVVLIALLLMGLGVLLFAAAGARRHTA